MSLHSDTNLQSLNSEIVPASPSEAPAAYKPASSSQTLHLEDWNVLAQLLQDNGFDSASAIPWDSQVSCPTDLDAHCGQAADNDIMAGRMACVHIHSVAAST